MPRVEYDGLNAKERGTVRDLEDVFPCGEPVTLDYNKASVILDVISRLQRDNKELQSQVENFAEDANKAEDKLDHNKKESVKICAVIDVLRKLVEGLEFNE